MNKSDALKELMRQAASGNKNSLASYRRACRALKALGFIGSEMHRPLGFLEYVNSETGEPYKWLAEKFK
jgi:hypothetical protein